MSVKNRITVNLEDDEYQALQRIAASTDRSLAWLGRRAICVFLQSKCESDNLTSALTTEGASSERRTMQ